MDRGLKWPRVHGVTKESDTPERLTLPAIHLAFGQAAVDPPADAGDAGCVQAQS